MTAHGVDLAIDAGVATITLDRPEVANGFDLPMAQAFGAAVTACASPEVSVVVLRGRGARFCAGGDVRAFHKAADTGDYVRVLASTLGRHVDRLETLPVPVVAAVQGAVAGAGLGLVLAADVVVAHPRTRFAMAYAEIGLSPDCGVSRLLPRVIGLRRALDLTVNRRTIDAAEALEWGLVTLIDAEPVATALGLAREIANGPARALGEARRLLRRGFDVPSAAHAADEVDTIAALALIPATASLISIFARGGSQGE